MRKTVVALVVVGLVVSVPLTVIAVTVRNGSRVDRQRSAVRSTPTSTSSTEWVDVPGLKGLDVCAKGQMSATVSLELTGAPVDVRVQFDDIPLPLKPRFAHVDPNGGTTAFSFTFVGRMLASEGSDGHLFDVQWRSSGGTVTLERGNVNLLFGRGSC
jgi:hypothetical protein